MLREIKSAEVFCVRCVNMLVIVVLDYSCFPNTGYSCDVEIPIPDLKQLLKDIFIIVLGVNGPYMIFTNLSSTIVRITSA